MLNCDSTSNQSLGEVGFVGSELEWTVPEQTPKGLSLTISSPKAPSPPPDSSQPGARLPAAGPGRLRSQEEGSSGGTASTRGPKYLVTSPWSPRPHGQATILWVHSGFWSQPGKIRQNKFKRCLMKGTLLVPVQPWDSAPPRFQGSNTIPNHGGQWE